MTGEMPELSTETRKYHSMKGTDAARLVRRVLYNKFFRQCATRLPTIMNANAAVSSAEYPARPSSWT